MKHNKRIPLSLKAAVLAAAAVLLFLLPGCSKNAAVLDTDAWKNEVKNGQAEHEPLFLFQGNTVAKPGDVVTVTGEYLDCFTAVTVDGKSVELIQPDKNALQFELPQKSNKGVFEVLLSGDGISRGLLINEPKIVWLQGDEGEFATPGGWLRVNGECLSVDGKGCYIELTDQNGTVTRVDATDVKDAFSAQIALPETLAYGTYSLRYSNGGALSGSAEIKIDAPVRASWPTDVFDIKEYQSRLGGSYDDALRAALADAEKNGGGVIYFPKGMYQMNSANFMIPKNVVLRGQDMNLVSLHWGNLSTGSTWPIDDLPQAIFWAKGNCALENLTIAGALMPTILDTDTSFSQLDYMSYADNVYVTNCRIYENIYAADMGFPKDQERPPRYDDQDVYAYVVNHPMFRMRCQNFQLKDCELQWDAFILGGNDKFGLKYNKNLLVQNNMILGASFHTMHDGAIVEDNSFTFGTPNRFFYGISGEKVYFARNHMLEGADSGDREVMSSDWNSVDHYYGPITFRDDTHVTFPEAATDLAVMKPVEECYFLPRVCVMIVDGTGTGQYRYVTERDKLDLTLEAPFETWDETSVFSVTRMNSNWYIVNNYFAYTGDLQFYTGQMDSVVYGNEFYFAAGIISWGLDIYAGYQCHWYNTYEDNYMHGSVYQHTFSASPTHFSIMYNAPFTNNIGTTIRRNRLSDGAQMHIGGYTPQNTYGFIVEDNAFEHSHFALEFSSFPRHTVVSGNTFTSCDTETSYPEDRANLIELN